MFLRNIIDCSRNNPFNRLYIILLLYYNIIYYIIVVVLCNIYNDLIFLEKNDTNMNNF